MSGLEVVPPRRIGSGSARGPPASQTRKTGLAPLWLSRVFKAGRRRRARRALARFAPPGTPPFDEREHRDPERDDWVQPPDSEQGIGEEAGEHPNREVGAYQVLPSLSRRLIPTVDLRIAPRPNASLGATRAAFGAFPDHEVAPGLSAAELAPSWPGGTALRPIPAGA